MPGTPSPVVDPGLLRLLATHVEPVVAAAGFMFSTSSRGESGGELRMTFGATPGDHEAASRHVVDSVLYEADPEPFLADYPQLSSDYGSQRVLCIDLWVSHDRVTGRLSANLEGHDVGAWATGHAEPDLVARVGEDRLEESVTALAAVLARMLAR